MDTVYSSLRRSASCSAKMWRFQVWTENTWRGDFR